MFSWLLVCPKLNVFIWENKKKILTTKMNLSIRKKGTTVFDNDIQTFYWNLPLTTQQKAYMSKKNSVNSAQSQMYLLTW